MISKGTRTVLLAHMDGPVPIMRQGNPQYQAYNQAIAQKWLREGSKYARGISPKLSYITEAGRYVLAKALGEWADALADREREIEKMIAQQTEPETVD